MEFDRNTTKITDSSFDYEKWGQMTFLDCFLIDRNGMWKIMKD